MSYCDETVNRLARDSRFKERIREYIVERDEYYTELRKSQIIQLESKRVGKQDFFMDRILKKVSNWHT